MKKVAIVLLMGLAIGMTFTSCTPEDQCGTVTNYSIGNNGNYIVYIDGTSHNVTFSTWWEANIGDYLCIEY